MHSNSRKKVFQNQGNMVCYQLLVIYYDWSGGKLCRQETFVGEGRLETLKNLMTTIDNL